MIEIDRLLQDAKKLGEQITAWRRRFHQYPETGLEVDETAGFICSILEGMGIRFQNGPYNSVIAIIPGILNKSPVALRADMDALKIPEQNSLEYVSSYKGRMHACGHDGHMAMLLGAAALLVKYKPPRDTFLVFQPGEEGPGGAEKIMASGLLDPVKEIYAIHLDPSLPTGTIAVNTGRAMASHDDFFISIKGKGGHAGLPHQAVDPIAIAAQIINSFQFIVSRLVDPVDPAVITLGTIKGGFMPNAIPEEVTLSGTIRTFGENTRKQIQREIRETIEMFCTRYGSEWSLQIESGYPPVINDAGLALSILDLTREFPLPFRSEKLIAPRMTAEDFSYYLSRIPGVFYWLGCSRDKSTSYPLHHSCFNLDENVLPLGAALHAAIVLNKKG